MRAGNIEITPDMMPSYLRPEEMDYHIYLMMQDQLGNRLGGGNTVQPMPQQNNMMTTPAWSDQK